MTKSKVHLLDSHFLIALATPKHSLNPRAAVWFRKGYRFATCPIMQGALVRFPPSRGCGLDRGIRKGSAEIYFLTAPARILAKRRLVSLDMPTTGIVGHRQVTDAYLGLLASKHGGSLATMDRSMAALHAGTTFIEQFPASD